MKPTEQRIRAIVGDLQASEVATYATVDEIPEAIVTITAKITHRSRVLACRYLHERVPRAPMDVVKEKVEWITERE